MSAPPKTSMTPLTSQESRMRLIALIVGIVILLALGTAARIWVSGQIPANNAPKLEGAYSLIDTYADDLLVSAESIFLVGGSRVIGNAALIGSAIAIDGIIEGDMTVVSENFRMGINANVIGDAAVVGEDVMIDGIIGGNVRLTATRLAIAETATIAGIIRLCGGGEVDDARISAVNAPITIIPCDENTRFAPFQGLIDLRDGRTLGAEDFASSGIASTVQSATLGLLLCALTVLIVVLAPNRVAAVQTALQPRPFMALRVGFGLVLFAMGAAVGTLLLLAAVPVIGLIVAAIGLVGAALLIIPGLWGWAGISLWIGRRIMAGETVPQSRLAVSPGGTPMNNARNLTVRTEPPPMVAAVLGSFILTAILWLIALLPFGGLLVWIAFLSLASLSIGAAWMTRMGVRSSIN